MTPPEDSHDGFSTRNPTLAERLEDEGELFVGLDFDGTLAPIVTDPESASIRPESQRWLRELAAHPDVALAVISGRALDDLVERVDLDRIIFAGNHGLELRYGDRTVVHPDAATAQDAMAALAERLRRGAAEIPGTRVEDKSLTLTVHYRETPSDREAEVETLVEDALADVEPDLELVAGKQVYEIRPAVDWDKGAAVAALSDASPAATAVYVGDDTTDEDAFRTVQPDGVGVKVGPEEDTAATVSLADPAEVEAFLAWLARDAL
ncbi:trehalose-phosphatase [Haloarculaceae archaeon H-GB11]|nr:trehalose-phosphatase [Haloarculaceae archaeon H-GB11]